MTIIMSKITTLIAEYNKISSKLKGGEPSPVDVLASFAEALLEKSGVLSVGVVRERDDDSEVVVGKSTSRSDVCIEAVVSESCGGSEGVVGTLSTF